MQSVKPFAAYILALVVFVLPVDTKAQATLQSAPQKPSEAYELATKPLREWSKSENQTLETNVTAWKEQERRAATYASLFKLDEWKGEQLLSLAQLYLAASQNVNAENAYAIYLRDPNAANTTLARKGLLSALFAQEKWREAIPVANLLLDAPKYDQDIILWEHALVDALRLTDPQQAIALAEKMLPGLLLYAESIASAPNLSSHAAEMLVYALEPAAIYRQRGDFAKSEAYLASFLSRLNASPLGSNQTVSEIVKTHILRTRLIGATAPPLEGSEYIDMPKMSPADLKGRVVMLDFWAHWCAPCIANFPATNALREKYGPKGLVIVGVTETYGFFGEQKDLGRAKELAALKSLKKEHSVQYGFIVGPHQNETAYGVMGLPVVVLIDRTGKVRYLKSGTGEGKAFEHVLEALLAEPKPVQ